MSTVQVKPLNFTDYRIRIGVDNFESAIPSCKFTPTTSTSTWKGGTPADTFTATGSPTWVCDLKFAQDWENEDSLSLYMLNHAGEEKEIEFFPNAIGPSFTADIILVAPEIGGDIDAWGESTVSCGVQGKPEFHAAAPVTP